VAALFERARRGDESVLPAVREALRDPDTLEVYGNLAAHARVVLLRQLAGQDFATQNAVVWRMERLRAELAGPDPAPLEALAVDRVVTSWLHVHALETRYGDGSGLPPAGAAHRQRSLSRAHARYLAALKALAVVRRLALPVVQLIVAQSQVNVGGPPELATERRAGPPAPPAGQPPSSARGQRRLPQ
jgi:hypothetical protein